ncbi:MAG: hypothetical protein IT453_09865 [Planctomycetes bacterium]|nr:hypothetical protein [Planctomycetota bacterium]
MAVPLLGTAPHESVDATQMLGEFRAQRGEMLDLLVVTPDGRYQSLDGPRTHSGTWYAFGGHLELRSASVGRHVLAYDLVGVDDELFLVPIDRLSKFTLEVRLGMGMSPSWLRRAARPDEPRPGLPPPFDEIVKPRAGEISLSEWRGGECLVLTRPGEMLHFDAHKRFEYRGTTGRFDNHERTVGGVAVIGDLLLLSSDDPRGAPNFAERMLFAPIRHGARRYLVPCDDLPDFARSLQWSPECIDSAYLADAAETTSGEWLLPPTFARWCRTEPLTTRAVRIGAVGAGSQRVNVVTLDVGRTQGAFRGLWLRDVSNGANTLRVVLVRENECDAVASDSRDDDRPQTVGTVFAGTER